MNLEEETIMPRDFCIELKTAVADKLDERQKIRLANQNTRFVMSSILHGEQGALSLSASLTQILRDPGAQEYAANQTREEARHVTGFSNYIGMRWGTPAALGHDAPGAVERDGQERRGLQEARRHADADRGPRDGRLRDDPARDAAIRCCGG